MPRSRFILSFAVSTLLAGCGDIIESSHSTLAAARADIERGWIPPILPVSAAQIRERHNLDTNVGRGSFTFGDEGSRDFKESLRPLPPDESTRGIHIPRQKMEREGTPSTVTAIFTLPWIGVVSGRSFGWPIRDDPVNRLRHRPGR